MKKLFLLFLSLIFLATKCPKTDLEAQKVEKLPDVTQSGANTIGFLKNGEIWIPASDATFSFKKWIFINFGKGLFRLSTDRTFSGDSTNQTFMFNIDTPMIFRPGVYILGTQKANAEFIDNKLKCYYVSDASQPCTLTITRIDSAVISGTFSMKINNPPCGTMNITEGRFDLKAN